MAPLFGLATPPPPALCLASLPLTSSSFTPTADEVITDGATGTNLRDVFDFSEFKSRSCPG